ncbi:molybdate ABC transporter permease subunit, partial [Nocardia otitidiscaviarum]|nr:molybdate ABC transporter permease subunit [Nocardia otitidiscaviarum]
MKLEKSAPARRRRWEWLRVTGSVGPVGIGIAVLWLSFIVLLPLAALTVSSFEDGWSGFWDAVTAPAALDSLRITVGVSVVVALLNVVMGTLIAWV